MMNNNLIDIDSDESWEASCALLNPIQAAAKPRMGQGKLKYDQYFLEYLVSGTMRHMVHCASDSGNNCNGLGVYGMRVEMVSAHGQDAAKMPKQEVQSSR